MTGSIRSISRILQPIRSLVIAIWMTGCMCAWPTCTAAQNLVPNPSFEEYEECPDDLNQIIRAVGWNRYRGSPDYFNACSDTSSTDVPLNFFGYQEASTGEAFAGVILSRSFPENSREHLGAILDQPLSVGIPVYLSLKVSPATGGWYENFTWTSNNAGVRFAMEPYLHNQVPPLPNQAAIFMDYTPMDTSTWYTLTGIYIPDSAYQCIVVGNFFDDAFTITNTLNAQGNVLSSYVYVDDICVSYDPLDCEIVASIYDSISRRGLIVYPNPIVDRFTIKIDPPMDHSLRLELYDQFGKRSWTGLIPPGVDTQVATVPDLLPGLYNLRCISATHLFAHVAVLRLPNSIVP